MEAWYVVFALIGDFVMFLAGKTVLITGAAGRIGSAVAHSAVAAGADVVLSDVDGFRLRSLEHTYLGQDRLRRACIPQTAAARYLCCDFRYI